MPECSNPAQCQIARREECTCDCRGANHGILRKYLDSNIPGEREEGQHKVEELRQHQAASKKEKKADRRKKRVVLRKTPEVT